MENDFFNEQVTEMTPMSSRPGGSPAAQMLRAIRNRYKLGLVVFILAAPVVVGLAVWRSAPYYQAEAIVEVNPIRPRILYNTGDNEPGRSYESFFQTQMAKVSSDMVLGKAVEDPSVRATPLLRNAASPLRTLRKALAVQRIENTQLFSVSVRSENPEGLATTVNAVIREYRAYLDQADAVSQNRRLQVLDGERKKLKLDSETKTAAVAKVREALAGDPSGTTGTLTRDPISVTQESIVEARTVRAAAEGKLRRLQDLGKDAEDAQDTADPESHPELSMKAQELIDADPQVKALNEEIGRQQVQLSDMSNTLQDTNPSLKRLQSTLQANRERVASLEKDLRAKCTATVKQMEMRKLEAEIESSRLHEAALDELLKTQIEQRTVYERKAAELRTQEDDLKRTQQTLLGIEQRLHELEIESGAPGFISIGATATEPKLPEPYLMRRLNYIAVGLGLCAGLALLLMILLDRRDDTIWTPDDMRYPAGAELLGCVPDGGPQLDGPVGTPALVCRHDPNSFFAEQLRNVMAGVLYPADGKAARSVLITGAAPGDGKTTLAANLATCVAGLGKRVLLVDANFRKPDLARVFDLGNIPGLGDILAYGADPGKVIHHDEAPNLDVLTAGSSPSCSAGMLGSNAMRDALQRFNELYDYVIIDGPPLLLADARILAPMVDGVVCSFRTLTTQRAAVEQSLTTLRRVGARIIGVALMGVSTKDISCSGTLKALDAYTHAEGAANAVLPRTTETV